MKFFVYGWRDYHEYVSEQEQLFRACLCAGSYREAWNLARALAPAECNHISVVCMSWL